MTYNELNNTNSQKGVLMKRLIVLVAAVTLFGVLGAIDLEWMGEFRTRGTAMYDDTSENLSNYIDSRFRLEFDANVVTDLDLRAAFEVGDFVWGSPFTSYMVETNEAYINYRLSCLNANLKIGKQYWADHRGLVFDDYITGAILSMDDLAGFKTEFGMLKFPLSNAPSTWWMMNMQTEAPMTMGITALAGYVDGVKMETISALPYVTLQTDIVTVDINPFLDYQYRREEFGMGAAVKANANLGIMEVGGDLLFAAENGLTTLSPWYQNGLYLYGIGTHHDGLNIYWNTPYEHNTDAFISVVGHVKYALNEKAKFFAAAGLLTDIGMEANFGLECKLIPDFLSASCYAALGINDPTDQTDMALGATLKAEF